MPYQLVNDPLSWIINNELASCGDGSTPVGVANRMSNELLENDEYLLSLINNNTSKRTLENRNPVLTDDSNLGYSTYSIWVNNLTDEVFICKSATVNNAVWISLSSTSTVQTATDEKVKVGDENGTSDYLSELFFDQISGQKIIPKYKINNNGTTGYDLFSSSYIKTNFYKIKHNLNSVTYPNQNNDSSQGYVKGSLWIDQLLKNVYVCVDDTANNAIWKNMNEDKYAKINNGTPGFLSTSEFEYDTNDSNKIVPIEKINDLSSSLDENLSSKYIKDNFLPIVRIGSETKLATFFGGSSINILNINGTFYKTLNSAYPEFLYLSNLSGAMTRTGGHYTGGAYIDSTSLYVSDRHGLYMPTMETSFSAPQMLSNRYGHSSYAYNNELYVIGGSSTISGNYTLPQNTEPTTSNTNVDKYTNQTMTWSNVLSNTYDSFESAYFKIADRLYNVAGRIYGVNPDDPLFIPANIGIKSSYYLNTTNSTITSSNDYPVKTAYTRGIANYSKGYIFGGGGGDDSNSIASSYSYDIISDSYTSILSMTQSMSIVALSITDDYIYLNGGRNSSHPRLRYDLVSNTYLNMGTKLGSNLNSPAYFSY